MYCPGRSSGVQGNDRRADRQAGKAFTTSGLGLGRAAEVLRSLRHYMRTQSQGYLTINRLVETGVNRGFLYASSLEGPKIAVVVNHEHSNCFKGGMQHWEHLLRQRPGGAHMGFSQHKNIILN